MALINISNVSIKGIAAAVPKSIVLNRDIKNLKSFDVEKFIQVTGIEERRVADINTTTADLCFVAAKKLAIDCKWNLADIDIIIFVSQTPDYILPATAVVLQDKLGVKKSCIAFDMMLGCSGYVYGLTVIANLLASGNLKKGLLLVGDTSSKLCAPSDKSTYPLFGDAGTATFIEYDTSAEDITSILYSDGSGKDTIMVAGGSNRNKFNANSLNLNKIEDGIERTELDLILDGMNVFSFGISEAPKVVTELLEAKGITENDVDSFVFHQGNFFMNEQIRRKLKLPKEKVPYSLKHFGNTSSATIPITIVTQLKAQLNKKNLSLILCGFGVGLSWGTMHVKLVNKLIISDLIEYDG